jgi:hypothetical protein
MQVPYVERRRASRRTRRATRALRKLTTADLRRAERRDALVLVQDAFDAYIRARDVVWPRLELL